jgi:predicted RNA binding protein YcfA (HicA-like mRNA interferase family)
MLFRHLLASRYMSASLIRRHRLINMGELEMHEDPGRIKMVENHGWRFHEQSGSHRQYAHPTKPGRVTIAGHPSKDIAPGTLRSILKQAGVK